MGDEQFEEALNSFDVLDDYKPMIGEELYSSTLLQIMIQVALENMRSDCGKKSFQDFQQRFWFFLSWCVPCASPSLPFLIHTLPPG
jgi:hypothetical protein